MFGGSLSPPGFEPSSTKQKRCAVPTVLLRDAFCSVAPTCSALYLCLPLSLSLCLALRLALSPPPRPSFAPSLHPPQGFFLVPLLLLTPPCLLSPVRHIAVHTVSSALTALNPSSAMASSWLSACTLKRWRSCSGLTFFGAG